VVVGEGGVARHDAEAHLEQLSSIVSSQADLGPLGLAEAEEDDGADDQRQQRRHPRGVGEHRREQRGERPHRGLDAAAACCGGGTAISTAAAVELTEAGEEEDECRVGDEHERDGAGASPGFADGER